MPTVCMYNCRIGDIIFPLCSIYILIIMLVRSNEESNEESSSRGNKEKSSRAMQINNESCPKPICNILLFQ